MLFTHERGSEASAPAANYPVLIFFGEKETRAFQTWPNLISWGRRGRARAAFPHRPREREGARVHRQLGDGQTLPAGWDRVTSRLRVPVPAPVPPLRERGALQSAPRGDVRERVARKGWKPPHGSPGSGLPGGEGMCFQVLLYVLIPVTSPSCHPTAAGNLGGKQSLESGNRPPNRVGGAVKIGSTCPE